VSLRVEYAEQSQTHDMIFIISLFCEYITPNMNIAVSYTGLNRG